VRRVGWVIGLALGACAAPDESESNGTTEGPASCEHGTYSACACPDGSMGTQPCAHDTSGFEPCVCGGDATEESSTAPETMTASEEDAATTSDADAETSSADESTSTTAPATDATSDAGPIGAPPTAMINHPGGEDRPAGVAIPFIGTATDPEDGPLSGDSMIWTDDLEGMIGEGEQFDAVLNVVGDHTVTLTATDADGNIGEATLEFAIVP
jgi:hypothetical protein